MNLISVKCRETSKHPLHHPHFPGHSPDQSTGPSSFWNISHSHRSKAPMPICRTSHTHLTKNPGGEQCCPQSSSPIFLLNPSPSFPGAQSRAAPGAEQGTTCSAVWTEESWLVRARPRAELLSQILNKGPRWGTTCKSPAGGRGVDRARGRWEGSTFSKVK